MKKTTKFAVVGIAAALAVGAGAHADPVVSNYDDLTESFLGSTFTYNGITYRDVNDIGGVFPGGDTFVPADVGNNFIIENATLLYNDFPGWGSPSNALTFGTSYVVGDNLSLGAFVRATMDLPSLSNAASFDMCFYENGPWGGIVFHLDALLNGQVVASDTLTIADGGGRDNITFDTLSVSGVEFNSLKIYATYGSDYSAPRLLIDDLSITPVPAPAAAGLFAGAVGALGLRRRRR